MFYNPKGQNGYHMSEYFLNLLDEMFYPAYRKFENQEENHDMSNGPWFLYQPRPERLRNWVVSECLFKPKCPTATFSLSSCGGFWNISHSNYAICFNNKHSWSTASMITLLYVVVSGSAGVAAALINPNAASMISFENSSTDAINGVSSMHGHLPLLINFFISFLHPCSLCPSCFTCCSLHHLHQFTSAGPLLHGLHGHLRATCHHPFLHPCCVFL